MECAKYKFDDAVSKGISHIFDGRFSQKNIRYTLRLSCKNANTNTERCKHLLLKLKRYSLEKHLFLTHHNRPKVLSYRRSSCHHCVKLEKL